MTARAPKRCGLLAVTVFACTASPSLAHDRCDIRYRLTALRDLGGGYSFTEDINERSQIVGYSINSDGEPHAYLWSPGRGMRDLTPQSDFSIAGGMNDRGQVVLSSLLASGESAFFVWSPRRPRVRIRPTLGGERTAAREINNHGQVVGWSDLANGDQHAILWSLGDNTLQDLGTLGGAQSGAYAINEHGKTVGHSNISNGPEHAFIWSPLTGRIRDLGSPAAAYSQAEDINERGHVVGRVSFGAISRALLWSRGSERRYLGTLGGSESYATGINNRNQVVGWSTTPPAPGFSDGPQHAFIWSSRCGMRDLNDFLVRKTEVTLTYASAINDRGQIAADGELGDFTQAYRLTPVPDEGPGASEDATGDAPGE